MPEFNPTENIEDLLLWLNESVGNAEVDRDDMLSDWNVELDEETSDLFDDFLLATEEFGYSYPAVLAVDKKNGVVLVQNHAEGEWGGSEAYEIYTNSDFQHELITIMSELEEDEDDEV